MVSKLVASEKKRQQEAKVKTTTIINSLEKKNSIVECETNAHTLSSSSTTKTSPIRVRIDVPWSESNDKNQEQQNGDDNEGDYKECNCPSASGVRENLLGPLTFDDLYYTKPLSKYVRKAQDDTTL